MKEEDRGATRVAVFVKREFPIAFELQEVHRIRLALILTFSRWEKELPPLAPRAKKRPPSLPVGKTHARKRGSEGILNKKTFGIGHVHVIFETDISPRSYVILVWI